MRDAIRRTALVALFGLLVIGIAFYALIHIQGPGPLGLGRLRLGMSLTEARDALPRPGWTTRVAASGDVVVESEGAELHFHEGMLVAARLNLPGEAADALGPRLEVSEMAVLRRSDRGAGRVEVELVSRTCPTHRDLVTRILQDGELPP